MTTDVVVIGAGFGGLAAAIAAAEFGLRTVVLERTATVGGSTSHSYGGVWVANSGAVRGLKQRDSRAAALRYMEYVGGGQTDPERVSAYIDNAPRALAFYQHAGIRLAPTPSLPDHFYGIADGAMPDGRHFDVAPFPGRELRSWRESLETPAGDGWRAPLGRPLSDDLRARARTRDEICQGAGLVAYALRSALDRNVEILLKVGMERLLMRKGRVVGVRTADGREFSAKRGVVIASGGFESDTALSAMAENLPLTRSVHAPTIAGDGFRMAADVGASFRIIHNNLAVLLAYDEPALPPGRNVRVIANKELVAPHGIIVNLAGERFGNEGSFQQLAGALRAFDGATRQPRNLPCRLVFDRQFVERNGFGLGGPGTVPDWVVRADSLDELAVAAGIDATNLAATVARFNGFAAAGVDRDFARGESGWKLAQLTGVGPNPGLGTLEKPPFFAVPLTPTAMGASGLAADRSARVLDWWDVPIPGLYAVGNAAAHDEYGVGYQAGQSLGSAMTFAFLAVEALAA
ncbi:MAG: FAD-dependent oxidoreductase [Candidatus Lustribacter sp.]